MTSNRIAVPGAIEIVEVAPRDGLQNEQRTVSTAQKIALIERMAGAGSKRIEVASFVRPDRVPQMADAEAVIDGVDLADDVTTIGLAMNLQGATRALATAVREIGAVCVASDAFAERNQGQTSWESARMAAAIVRLARREGRRANVTIGAAFGCPFEGEVDAGHVIALARHVAEAEPVDVAVADTIGVAVPAQVAALVARLREALPGMPIRAHLHNTRNMGIANAWAAVAAGATTLDASLGGIGGCPFAPAATGNIATEDLIYLLDRSSVATGYDLERTIDTARWLSRAIGRDLPAMVSRAGPFPPAHPRQTIPA